MKPDVLYLVRPGDQNDELRWSLRSVDANLPHAQVHIAGYTPSWVRNVNSIDVPAGPHKYRNTNANLRAGLDHVSKWFYLFNDDFHCMRYGATPPEAHRGPFTAIVKHGVGSSDYINILRRTARHLQHAHGIQEPMCYELHIPMLINRDLMRDILDNTPSAELDAGIGKRSLYGNLAGLNNTAVQMADVRPFPEQAWDQPFISTIDRNWPAQLGDYVRARFPNPGAYEDLRTAPRITGRLWIDTHWLRRHSRIRTAQHPKGTPMVRGPLRPDDQRCAQYDNDPRYRPI